MKKVFLSARLRELAARSGRFVEFAGGPGFEALENLAVQLRAMQLYAHNAHNQTRGENFFADHEFLGGLYAAYTEGYDDVVELLIGEGAVPDLQDFQMRAAAALAGMGDGECFCSLLGAEAELQGIVERIAAVGVDQGILQIVGSLAQASKARVYKLKQRMASSSEEKEFGRGDFLRQAISKFPDAAPAFSPGSSPSFVAPRGREWRAQFLQWARKRKQSQAVMN